MGRQTKNLPILQDFIPYWGRCPDSQRKIYANKEKQGKGIADHLMPLGDRFFLFFLFFLLLFLFPLLFLFLLLLFLLLSDMVISKKNFMIPGAF